MTSFVDLADLLNTFSFMREGGTRIEVDNAGNVVRIMVDGRGAVIIDEDGAHVQGEIGNAGEGGAGGVPG